MSKEEGSSENRFFWQKQLLPWFILMPTILIAIFIFLASRQISKFNEVMDIKPDSTLIGTVLPLIEQGGTTQEVLAQEKYLKWVTLAKLEQESYYRRYHQAGMILMTRIYTKYLGFFTGMILAIVGSVFIIGKIREESSELGGEAANIKLNIVSTSPGIIFALLGTILMLATILNHDEMVVQDSPLYLNSKTMTSMQLDELKDLLNVQSVQKKDSSEVSEEDIQSDIDMWK